jgi:hypothetical protein
MEAADIERSKQLETAEKEMRRLEEQLKIKEAQLTSSQGQLSQSEAARKEVETRLQKQVVETETRLKESDARGTAGREEVAQLRASAEHLQRAHEQDMQEQRRAHEEVARQWSQERSELLAKQGRLEEEIGRRDAHEAKRDALAAAILNAASDERQRDDDFKFWQARKLPWRRVSSTHGVSGADDGDVASPLALSDATARLAVSIGSEIGSQIGSRLAGTLTASKEGLLPPHQVEEVDAFDASPPLALQPAHLLVQHTQTSHPLSSNYLIRTPVPSPGMGVPHWISHAALTRVPHLSP